MLVPPNLDGFMTVHKIVGHELDWVRRRFIFVPPNPLGASNLFYRLESGMFTTTAYGKNKQVTTQRATSGTYSLLG